MKYTNRLAAWVLVNIGAAAPAVADSSTLLHEVFQDHAVLQRDRPIRIWGEARRGEELRITFDDASVTAHADTAGHWQATLPAMGAGGPHTLEVDGRASGTRRIADVLIGDVFLCSGQSNMELSLENALNGAREVDESATDRIRVLHIDHAIHPTPLVHFAAPIQWHAAAPAYTREFSAVCYFFARELQKTVDVPIGLIEASWGGSRIEPWISAAGLHAVGGFEDGLRLLRTYAKDPVVANADMGRSWERWWQSKAPPASRPWEAEAQGTWSDVPEPMRDWKTWGVPQLAQHDGMVWFRRTVTLTAAQAAQTASLSIGAIDEVDETWVNGRAVGNSFGYGSERTYGLPRGVLHAGDNVVVINVLSTWDAGGMYGPPEHLKLAFADGSSAALGGAWRYQFVPESMGYPPRAPWESVAGLSSIYNAMIAPLQSLSTTGVLWYQGESNAGDATHYTAALRGLIHDWRRQLGDEVAFFVVQLPNFGSLPRAPSDAPWARLRQAQLNAVAAENRTALTVTIDLGEPGDLHPRNKRAVSVRLAAAARRLLYGDPTFATGPVARRAYRDGGDVVVDFEQVNGQLAAFGAAEPAGFELCAAAQSSCRYVTARIAGNSVHIGSASGSDNRVRLCWSDSPVCNLYDGLGLPAGPFELGID